MTYPSVLHFKINTCVCVAFSSLLFRCKNGREREELLTPSARGLFLLLLLFCLAAFQFRPLVVRYVRIGTVVSEICSSFVFYSTNLFCFLAFKTFLIWSTFITRPCTFLIFLQKTQTRQEEEEEQQCDHEKSVHLFGSVLTYTLLNTQLQLCCFHTHTHGSGYVKKETNNLQLWVCKQKQNNKKWNLIDFGCGKELRASEWVKGVDNHRRRCGRQWQSVGGGVLLLSFLSCSAPHHQSMVS